MSISSAAPRHLDQQGIPYRIFQHTSPPLSLEQAAAERGQKPHQIIRSILFRHEHKYYVMVLMAGPGQIAWKRIREHLGVSRISMATEAEVRQVTGYELGAVNPLGLPRMVRILADSSVFIPEEVSIGSGVRGVAIVIKSEDLKHAIGKFESGSFAV